MKTSTTDRGVVRRTRWRIRVRRVRGEPRTDIDRFIFWKRLSVTVRRKGPDAFTDPWRRWLANSYLVDTLPTRHRMSWRMFVVLTIDERCRQDGGLDRAALGERTVRTWCDQIAKMIGQHPLVVFAFERTRAGQREVPALVALPDADRTPTTRAVERAWSHGHAHVRKFRPAAGGAAYVTKGENWGQMFGCPRRSACRRPSGCRWKGERLHPATT